MKRVFLTAALFVALLLQTNIASAQPAITVSNATGKVGDIVEVTVGLANNPGVSAVQILLHYDKNVLAINEVIDTKLLIGSNFPTQWVPGYNYPEPLTIDWVDGLNPDNTANGAIVKIRFRVLAAQNSVITVSPVDIFNFNFEEVYFSSGTGNFTIIPLASGDGTAGNPYTISNAAELDAVRNYSDKSFIVINDIDLTGYLASGGAGYAQWGDAGWLPINNFTGNLDGAGYKITGLQINRTSPNVGLFGSTNGATVKSLGLESVDVNGLNNVGGLVGNNVNSTIENCYATGNVTGTGTWVGGLVGNNNASTIRYSFATANVTGNGVDVGGLAGLNAGPITDCYATGNVTGGNGSSNIGGLVGFNSGRVTNCYAAGIVTVSVPVPPSVGGLVGNNSGGIYVNCFFDLQTTKQIRGIGSPAAPQTGVTGIPTAGMQTQATFIAAGWNFTDTWSICNGKTYPFLQWQDIICEGGGPQTITWTGAENNLWTNANNWGITVPNESDDVIIPSGLTNYPQISSNVTITNLIMEQGAAIDLNGNSLNVTAKIQIKSNVATQKWLAAGFPFAIEKLYSEWFEAQGWSADLLPYNATAYSPGFYGDYWLKEYAFFNPPFSYTQTWTTNKGYIIQFPGWFDTDNRIIYISEDNQTISDGSLNVTATYQLFANPTLKPLNLIQGVDNKYYYKLNSAGTVFEKPTTAGVSIVIEPFESVIAVQEANIANLRNSLSVEEMTGILYPVVKDDPVVAQCYYTLQGVRIEKPKVRGIYIVRQILQSGRENSIKIWYNPNK